MRSGVTTRQAKGLSFALGANLEERYDHLSKCQPVGATKRAVNEATDSCTGLALLPVRRKDGAASVGGFADKRLLRSASLSTGQLRKPWGAQPSAFPVVPDAVAPQEKPQLRTLKDQEKQERRRWSKSGRNGRVVPRNPKLRALLGKPAWENRHGA